ncbi:MAG TPA: uroporphyrinogen decarboxylase family protein [Candidatus Lokiarchaeia archaeon]|nr:uroporphyrinogen decarboxylase family protein [Candidatus Lokiarchaeia archaeon]
MTGLLETIPPAILDGLMGMPGAAVPTFPIILGYSVNAYHEATGIPAQDIMRDGDKVATAQLHVARRYHLPFVISMVDLNVIGEAFGSQLTYMPNVIPVLETPAIRNIEDIDRLEPRDPRRDGRMPEVLKTAKALKTQFNHPGEFCFGGCEGPVTAAGSAWGVENLMRNMVKNPRLVHKVLSAVTDTIIEFCNAQLEAGVAAVGFADPTASSTCISPAYFNEFAMPYLKKITRKVNSPGFLLHICGESLGITGDVSSLGASRLANILQTSTIRHKVLWNPPTRDRMLKFLEHLSMVPKIEIFSVDRVDLAAAKQALGKRFVILLGNVSTSVLRFGTPEDVEREARACIRAGAHGGNYILSSGCDIAPGTPPANIEALMQTGQSSRFPID